MNDPKALTNFLVLNWTCRHFVTQFDRLWELFERENMRQAARTRGTDKPKGLWALALSPGKVKANRIPPDKAFLIDMDDDQKGWRVRLAKDMKKHNPEADGGLITAAVQLLIDRLIFIKALSDREIEDDYLADLAKTVEHSGMADSDTGWFASCREIFRKLDKFYNGSIFRPRPELEAVVVSNKVVRDIIRSMQPENSPYNFAVMPVEILGTIYERFLGRVVRATEKQVKIEEKPEVRKAGGVYYTPQYIVDYIVKQTVGKLLEKCRTPEDAAKLKILDPACGSGSFLVGAYSALIDWHLGFYDGKARLTARDRGEAYRDSDGSIRLTARLKRRILLNNLFGVDIDPQAVEVTRFSLSLKALDDTRRDELTEERSLFKETVLPELSDNIKCGNSLIGPDYFSGRLMPDPQEMLRVNPFDWDREFREIMARGGFDAVIGNPPYVRQEGLGEFKGYFEGNYKVYHGAADLFAYFIERGVSLLNGGGIFSYIVSNKWMRANYGVPLRKWLKQQPIEEIIDFGDLPVFQTATTYPCIIRIAKAGAANKIKVIQVSALDFSSLSNYVDTNFYEIKKSSLDDNGWSLANEKTQSLLAKISAKGIPLGEYVKGKIYRGVLTGLNEAFVIDEAAKKRLIAEDPKSAEIIKPFLAGRDIKRYEQPTSDKHLIFAKHGINIDNFPAIKRYLGQFKDMLMPRPKSWKGENWKGRKPGAYQWYEIQDTIDYHAEFEKSKIIVPAIVQNASYAFDRDAFYSNDKTSIIPTDDLYLLGILNSKIADLVIHSISSTKQGGYFEYKPMYVQQIPIRTIDFSIPRDKGLHDKMVKLVESMLALHKHKAAAKTQPERELYERQIKSIDSQIDALVYELYELTPEEIAIVEDGRS